MTQTSIEWTDKTWNPVTGCSKVSPGCAHCYAETLAKRLHAFGQQGYTDLPWTPENAAANVFLHPDRLEQPLHWRKPRMVFVNSMSDLFHEQVPLSFLAEVWKVMVRCPQHTFQILTKRPERMARALGPNGIGFYLVEGPVPCPQPNIWLGTSIENRRYVHRADVLRETPAAVRFVSAEPLLGPLLPDATCLRCGGSGKVGNPEHPDCCGTASGGCGGSGRVWSDGWQDAADGMERHRRLCLRLDLTAIDWLIVGGESGPRHRPMRMEWVRDLRDACLCHDCDEACEREEAVGPIDSLNGQPDDVRYARCGTCEGRGRTTAFFFRQLGGTRSGSKLEDLPEDLRIREIPVAA